MAWEYENTIYAKLNIDFDRELFCKEYDEFILPKSTSLYYPAQNCVDNTKELNKFWGMVDPELYDSASVSNFSGDKMPTGRAKWKLLQLLELDPKHFEQYPELLALPDYGGIAVRSMTRDKPWTIKPEFADLNLVKFVYEKLPLERIVSFHTVSNEPGDFTVIHRDARHVVSNEPSRLANNGLYKDGYVLITLNLSDGGQPLWWCLDNDRTPIKSNEKCYLTNDYFLHGVGVMTSRRRQVRITGWPTKELRELIDESTRMTIPSDFNFNINYWGKE